MCHSFRGRWSRSTVALHGKSLLGDEIKNRKYIFAARDKMDNAHDSMRTIRSKDFKLILNLMPERPWLQFSRYKEQCYPMLAEMGAMHLRGELTPAQAAFFAPRKPEVELFDLKKDPHEVNNVANDLAYADKKNELLTALNDWRENVIQDQGVSEPFRGLDKFPESLRGDLSVDQWVLKNRDQLDPEFSNTAGQRGFRRDRKRSGRKQSKRGSHTFSADRKRKCSGQRWLISQRRKESKEKAKGWSEVVQSNKGSLFGADDEDDDPFK